MATPEVLPALYQAAPPPLRAWLDRRTQVLTALVLRARRASAGRSLGRRDVGEKIGGARKDIAELRKVEQLAAVEALGAGAAYKAVSKAAVLGEFDAHAARAAGDTAGCAYLKRELWHAVQARPEDTPAARHAFVEGCAFLRTLLAGLHDVEAIYAALNAWGQSASPYGRIVDVYLSPTEFDARFGSGGPDVLKRVSAAGYSGYGYFGSGDQKRVGLMKRASLAVVEKNAGMIDALGPRIYGAVHGSGKGSRSRSAFYEDVRRKALAYEKLGDWSWSETGEAPEGQPKKRNEFVFVRSGLTGARSGGPPVGKPTGAELQRTFGLRGVEHGIWMSDDDADTGEASAYGALLDLSLVLGLPATAMGLGGRLGLALGARGGGKHAAHYEPAYRVINLTKTQGAGTLAHEWGHALDHWLGDPTGKSGRAAYMSHGAKCGIHGVDAAFANVMRAIIGEGRLEDALVAAKGPKKNPSAAEAAVDVETPIADYADRNRRVDALNAWYNDAVSRRRAAVTGSEEHAEVQNEMARHGLAVQAFKKLDRAFKAGKNAAHKAARAERATAGLTKYAKGAAKLGEYWARPQELFARAWEACIEDTLKERGMVSGYLVTGTRASYGEPEVYPQGEEREAINVAMRGLIATIRANWS